MGLLDRLFDGFGARMAAAEIKSADDTQTGGVLTPMTSVDVPSSGYWPSEADFDGWINAAYGMYCREYAVRIVVDFISRQIGSLPFKVYRKNTSGDAEEVRDGALAQLMHNPSVLPGVNRYRFVCSLMRDMLLEDAWLCVLGISGDRWTLRRIPADSYDADMNVFGEVVDVSIRRCDGLGVEKVMLPDPRVVMDVGYVDSLRFGDPVTSVLKPLLRENRAMMRYRAAIASNGAQVPAYVYRPKEMPWESQEDYDTFVQGLRSYAAGGGNEGMWPTLKDGMEIRPLDNVFKPVDMNDLEARDRINIMVANAFQISPENLGFREGTNSNISAYKEKLWNVELLPYLIAFEDALNATLPDAVGEPDCYIRANLDSKLRGTMSEQYQALSTATGRPFMTTNQARSMLDMPKVDGGDELITPLNVSEGGQPSPQDGGRTQNAQTNTSQNGKSADEIFHEFRYRYTYDAEFRRQWDEMSGKEAQVES